MNARPIGTLVRGLVLSAIDTCPHAKDKLERIRIALECGLLSEEEATEKRAIVERMQFSG